MHCHLNVNLSRCTVTWTSVYQDARSPERQFITMHGHLNVNLSRCTVTWTSFYHDARSPERQFISMHGHLNVCITMQVTWTSIYDDERSPERQFITMHGHLNVNLSRCTVTWTSKDLQKILTYVRTRRRKAGGTEDVFVMKIYMKTVTTNSTNWT